MATLGYSLQLGGARQPRAPGAATVAACALGVSRGARVVRLHDARGPGHAVDLATALQELSG
jgi:dihydropteroate synthase